MKTFCVALALVLGCSREPQPATNTIAPAEPRPERTLTSTAGTWHPLATDGSPRPATAPAPGTTFVTVGNAGIDVQPLLPRAHTAFHVRNDTGMAHEIVVRGASGSSTAPLPANGTTVVQLLLGAGTYEIACTMPGHAERARFETYAPGAPLPSTADPGGRTQP